MFSTFYNRLLSLFKPTVPMRTVRRRAGQYAEDEVQNLLQQISSTTIPDSALIHNGLFVFHRDTDQEFSVETDHIFITTKNIYLIETKFKSGVVYAPPRKPFWKVLKKGGYSPFRNGLQQVLKSSSALQRLIPLPVKIIPLVVMVGPHLRLHGNNHEVLRLDDLITTITRIESETHRTKALQSRKALSIFSEWLSANPDDLFRHQERVTKIKSRKSIQLAKHLHLDEPCELH